MKPHLSKRRIAAITLFDVCLAIVVVMILAIALLPIITRPGNSNSGNRRMACLNDLKQIGLSFQEWAGDHNDKYPMGISVTNGGSMEVIATGNIVQTFLALSNELDTPRRLYCPSDASRNFTTNFSRLSNSNISYFVSADATHDMNPQMILSGDSNFEIGDVPVKSGLLEIAKGTPVAWTQARHGFSGNIGLADGSVRQISNSKLTTSFGLAGIATNRLAIP